MSRFSCHAGLLLTLTLALGCGDAEPLAPAPVTTPAATSSPPDQDDHARAGHGAGPHDGTLADWGGGKFHVEFCVDHDRQEATVYVLGDDEKTARPVKAGTILLSITDPVFQIELAAAPQEGDVEGMASRFVGRHESLGNVREFAGTISGEVDGTPYAGDFKEEPHDAHDHK